MLVQIIPILLSLISVICALLVYLHSHYPSTSQIHILCYQYYNSSSKRLCSEPCHGLASVVGKYKLRYRPDTPAINGSWAVARNYHNACGCEVPLLVVVGGVHGKEQRFTYPLPKAQILHFRMKSGAVSAVDRAECIEGLSKPKSTTAPLYWVRMLLQFFHIFLAIRVWCLRIR